MLAPRQTTKADGEPSADFSGFGVGRLEPNQLDVLAVLPLPVAVAHPVLAEVREAGRLPVGETLAGDGPDRRLNVLVAFAQALLAVVSEGAAHVELRRLARVEREAGWFHSGDRSLR